VRCRKGRKANTSFLIIDAQSVGNTGTAKRKGFDAGKKVSGIKRHIGVDSQGLPHFIAVTAVLADGVIGASRSQKALSSCWERR
jgi:Transposase DDE domain